MSTKPKPATTVNDPYKNMPDWVKSFYQSEIDIAKAGNERADELRETFSDPDRLIADYAGAEGTQMVQDAAAGAVDRSTAAYDSAVSGLTSGKAKADMTLEEVLAGLNASRQNLSGINTELGTAYDTAGDRAAMAAAVARGTAASDRALAGMEGLTGRLEGTNYDFGQAYDTSGERAALEGMDIEAIQNRYRDENIEGIVNPILSRMREDEARRLAQLEASGAAIGGGSNTRMAVEMARTTDEGLRSRAQTESELRSKSLRAGQELGLQEAQLRGSFADMAAKLGLSESELNAQISKMEADTGLDRDQLLKSIGDSVSQIGLSSGQFAANTAAASGQLGLSESELASQIAERQARLGLSVEEATQSVLNDMRGTAESGFGMADKLAGLEAAKGDAALTAGRVGMDAGAFTAEQAEAQRKITQEKLQAPLTAESWFRDITSTPLAAPLPSSNTQTQSGGGPSLASTIIGGGVSLAGALLSDERVKTDIEPLQHALDIIRNQRPSVYAYTDKNLDRVPVEGRRSAGLMAQDLEDIPGAVIIGEDGLRRVDSYPVMATIAAALQELDRKVEAMSHG